MIRPNTNDLRHAMQITLVRREVENFMAQMVVEGRSLVGIAEPRYFYLGPNGGEAMEQITEESFYGQDEENPRQPGFYAVDVVTLVDGKSCVPRPWFAVYRDQSRDVGQQRDKSTEAAIGDILEEYRILNAQTKRELQEQIRKNHNLQTELDTFQVAYNKMRQQSLAYEIERDKAIHDAEHMEHERNLAIQRCNQLEEESASFRPQIEQTVDAFMSHVAPHAQRAFLALSGFGDEEESSGEGDETGPSNGGGGGGGANGGGGGAQGGRPGPRTNASGGAPSNANGASSGASSGASASAQPGASGQPAQPAQTWVEGNPEMPTPEFLVQALYHLFWESEHYGRHIHLKQKDENGNPFVPWWMIRGIVLYHSQMDLGPSPIWPSDVREPEAGNEAREEGSPAPSAKNRSPQRSSSGAGRSSGQPGSARASNGSSNGSSNGPASAPREASSSSDDDPDFSEGDSDAIDVDGAEVGPYDQRARERSSPDDADDDDRDDRSPGSTGRGRGDDDFDQDGA